MVSLLHSGSEIFFLNGDGNDLQLVNTTHLGIGAHQDDLEMLAIHGILEAYDNPSKFFTGVTVTNGKGAPRSGRFADLADDEYVQIRNQEQKNAARIGKYNAQFFLNYDSEEIKSPEHQNLIQDLKTMITVTSPSTIYTHNLADRHDTHVAVVLSVIQALQELDSLPENIKLFGCEVWRDLDWLPDDLKIKLDVSSHPKLQKRILSIYQSQKVGNKNYLQAVEGRRIANATFSDPFSADHPERLILAMDLTPLIHHPENAEDQVMTNAIQTFAKDVRDRLNRCRRAAGTSLDSL
jgi:LmbE family N-acetylglucosaminyl deacetylase